MKLYPSLPPDLAAWAQRQPLFLTATAGTHTPHVNVSPKGLLDTHFAVLSPSQCAYIDRTGSGCETIAHAYENGRLCLMFMSFGHAPRILRLFCRATVVEYDDARFGPLVRRIGAGGGREVFEAARAVIVADIWEVQTSCGYGVPRVKRGLYHGVGGLADEDGDGEKDGQDRDEQKQTQERRTGDARSEWLDILRSGIRGGPSDPLDELCVFEDRPTLDAYWEKKSGDEDTARSYRRAKNVASLDGLPGLRASRRDAGERLWVQDLRAWMARMAAERQALAVGFVVATLLSLLLRWLGW
ncbi:hypothetical protein E4U43_000603 [Claviceps pusilla]|uniref:Pyridoxamine phosphate oxidase family protein n=1 Tax=Claviceps pusilla TaxID=123648 RepID=A0A9P7NBM8_9HYPO|nr:hypothetical protein E4U43_000603 [Claviceps pusilla]